MVGYVMEPRMCLSLHNPPQTYGDCIRACIATLTDDDDVPHVFDSREAEECWLDLRNYLAGRNKFLAILVVPDPFEFMEENNQNIAYMLICKTQKGENHAVVCKNGKIVHDPAYYKSEITGPPEPGEDWFIGIVGDLV